MIRRNKYKLLDIASMVIIVLVLFIIAMFFYIRFWPIDVIKNQTWVLCTAPLTNHRCETGTPTFHVGDGVPVYINSDKIRNVGGTFTVSAECKNQTGSFVSYPISESHVNRAKGHVETEIDTKIPDKIPTLPTTCRIAYVLEYSVYSFRSFSEYNFSNEFTLLPAEKPTVTQQDTSFPVNYFPPTTPVVNSPAPVRQPVKDTSGEPSTAPSAPKPTPLLLPDGQGLIRNSVPLLGRL